MEGVMSVQIKAVYKNGLFEPIEPIEGLTENQQVQLEVSVAPLADDPSIEDEGQWWVDLGFEEDWAQEQPDVGETVVMVQDAEAAVQWVNAHWGIIALSEAQALEIAMADWLLEEDLSV
jgi:hypothetical protein